MNSNVKLLEALDLNLGPGAADIDTADVTSTTYLPMDGYERVLAIAVAIALSNTKKITVSLKQATSAAGAGAKALGSPVVQTAPAGGGNTMVAVEARAADMDRNNGFTHVGVTIGTDEGSAIVGSAVILRGPKDFSAGPPTFA